MKYWYKFVNEIVFDGIPFTVKFTIRDKGKEQYQYLIAFKENKTPGLSNTVASNLLRSDQVSYDDSIRNPDEIVNHKSTTESTGNPDIRYKVSAAQDTEYMNAVSSMQITFLLYYCNIILPIHVSRIII